MTTLLSAPAKPTHRPLDGTISALTSYIASDDFARQPIQERLGVRRQGCELFTAEAELKDALVGRNDGFGLRQGHNRCRLRARRALAVVRSLLVDVEATLA